MRKIKRKRKRKKFAGIVFLDALLEDHSAGGF